MLVCSCLSQVHHVQHAKHAAHVLTRMQKQHAYAQREAARNALEVMAAATTEAKAAAAKAHMEQQATSAAAEAQEAAVQAQARAQVTGQELARVQSELDTMRSQFESRDADAL